MKNSANRRMGCLPPVADLPNILNNILVPSDSLLEKGGKFLHNVQNALFLLFVGKGVKVQLFHGSGVIAGGDDLTICANQGSDGFSNEFAVEITYGAVSGLHGGLQSAKNDIVQRGIGQMLF